MNMEYYKSRYKKIEKLLKYRISRSEGVFDNNGVRFKLCHLEGIKGCVCHYEDTLDDGDVFYYDDYTDEEIVGFIIKEAT